MAAFNVLMHHYTGQDDIVVGTDVASRNRSELEGLIGFFVNQIVLRTDLSGNPTFQELIQHVYEVNRDAYSHQDVPFDKLVSALRHRRDPSRPPLFQVKLVLRPPLETLKLPGLTVQLMEVDNETTKFDLLFNIWDIDQKLLGSLEYSTALFNPSTVAQMLAHLKTILNTVVEQPDIKLNTLKALLLTSEKQQRTAQTEKIESVRGLKLQTYQRKAIKVKK
jgi:non-ribosomal peptide synthetase component F